MVQIDENIKKQLDKPRTWFCKYFPKRIQNVGEKESLIETLFMPSRMERHTRK